MPTTPPVGGVFFDAMTRRKPLRNTLLAAVLAGCCWGAAPPAVLAAGTASPPLAQQLGDLPSSALYFATAQGEPLQALRADTPLVPASTLKLLTAHAALQAWGADHRFHTDVLLGANDELIVRGYGDPMLVSEEIDRIVQALRERGLASIAGVRGDGGYFAADLRISGRSTSDNPYDAAPGALACNFNTIYVRKRASGAVSSAESQTPLTATARRLAQDLPPGRHRISLGSAETGAGYCAELFAAKLREAGVRVGAPGGERAPPAAAGQPRLLYRHHNSRRLADVVAAMLLYSNNVMANQLFLLLGAASHGAPADMAKARQAMAAFVEEQFDWRDHAIVEGSGLARDNRLSARQLVDVLEGLRPYAALLPRDDAGLLAKTGTLQGVSNYAGYVPTAQGLAPFALIINHRVDPTLRYRLAKSLSEQTPP